MNDLILKVLDFLQIEVEEWWAWLPAIFVIITYLWKFLLWLLAKLSDMYARTFSFWQAYLFQYYDRFRIAILEYSIEIIERRVEKMFEKELGKTNRKIDMLISEFNHRVHKEEHEIKELRQSIQELKDLIYDIIKDKNPH